MADLSLDELEERARAASHGDWDAWGFRRDEEVAVAVLGLIARIRDAESVREGLLSMVRQLDGATAEGVDCEAIERVLGTSVWDEQLTVVKADTVRRWMAKIEGLRRTLRSKDDELRLARVAQSNETERADLERSQRLRQFDNLVARFRHCEEYGVIFDSELARDAVGLSGTPSVVDRCDLCEKPWEAAFVPLSGGLAARKCIDHLLVDLDEAKAEVARLRDAKEAVDG